MGKYEPLAKHLATLPADSWNARFSEVEDVLGFDLPQSAFRHRAWWANQNGTNHSQTEGWRSAGWETREIDFTRRTVRFERALRSKQLSVESGSVPFGKPNDAKAEVIGKLLAKAREITGLQDQDTLLEAALNALIQRELANYVASLGGSMADAVGAPRRRVSW